MKKILCITTDPVDCIRGYSLIFQKISNNINFANVNLVLNKGGQSNRLIAESNCKCDFIDISNRNYFIKGFFFIFNSLKKVIGKKYDIVLCNCELPEMITALIYSKIKRVKSTVLIHDLYARNSSRRTKFINSFRILLLKYFDIVLSANSLNLKLINNRNKFTLGYILCDENGNSI